MFDAITALTPGDGQRVLTPDERAEVEDVLDAARAWATGGLPWQEVARLGRLAINGHPSEAYTRFVAVVTTPPSDPRRAALLDLLDVLVAAEGYHITRQGTYTTGEMHAHDAAVAWVRQNEDAA